MSVTDEPAGADGPSGPLLAAARTHAAAGRVNEAIIVLEEIVEGVAEVGSECWVEAAADLVGLYNATDDVARSEQVGTRGLAVLQATGYPPFQGEPGVRIALHVARAHVVQGDGDRAIELLRAVLDEEGPGGREDRLQGAVMAALGRALLDADDPKTGDRNIGSALIALDAAAQLLDQAGARADELVPVRTSMARAAYLAGDTATALAVLDEHSPDQDSQLSPDHLAARHILRGQIHHAQADLESSARSLSQADECLQAAGGGRTVAELWAALADAFELLSDIDGSLHAHRQAVMALLKPPHLGS